MTILLGLDIGSNSVGSAWVDTEKEEIAVGVSVFPAGVDETDERRGAPKNQDRRTKRSLRRTLARRSQRKRRVRQVLAEYGLLPKDRDELRELMNQNPWPLRGGGIHEPLTAYEFGRALVHLGQRRGALGLKLPDPDEATEEETDQKAADDAKVKAAIEKTRQRMGERDAQTFGELMAIELEHSAQTILDQTGKPRLGENGQPKTFQSKPIRNRLDSFEFHADRNMIHDEFQRLWKRQSEPGGALSHLDQSQREQLKKALDNPERDATWRHKGHLFGQRDTYWDTGTLGRCDLEPTDRCVPIADRHASEYRVLESVNNIRIRGPQDRVERPLAHDEREKVIAALQRQKTGSPATVRKALDIHRKAVKAFWSLNIERDEDREINTDWFHREIVLGAVGEDEWNLWPESKREGLNRAILKCDPAIDDDADRLRKIAKRLELDGAATTGLIAAWQTRPKLEKRLNLSRRAILNLLPYMDEQQPDGRWPTQIEARRMFAEDNENGATERQRRRYRLGGETLRKADRHFLKKHPNELPAAPTLSNPVVRKAIHEVRRHIIEHMHAQGGKKPDRVVIEFARETNKSKKLSDWILMLNRKREKIRKNIIEEVVKPAYGSQFQFLSHNQLQSAVDRVILARQQKERCAYSGTEFGSISPFVAARGDGLEIDHIIPYSRCGNNSWSNRVLCWQKSNRDKGKRTPREWWKDEFNERSHAIAFMDGYEPARGDPNEYFTKADYTAKWKNFSREDVPNQWRGSQLTDTAYASREVQAYLENALWPDEPSYLDGGLRRIFVTKGAYTHQLRKDWQLFQKLIDPGQDSREEVRQASAKNRGDHREHGIDAVAIAFVGQPGSVAMEGEGRLTTLIDDLAHYRAKLEEEQLKAKQRGVDARGMKREPLPPPWGTVKSFRRQVMSIFYGEFDELDGAGPATADDHSMPIVVSHRPVGRRIIGSFHEDSLFGPVPGLENTYIARKRVTELTPAHLRLPVPETKRDSIDRLAGQYFTAKLEKTKTKARNRAKAVVESTEFMPPLVDPPPGKSGLVRDRALRTRLRECIAHYEYVETDREGKVKVQRRLDPDNFSAKEIKQAFEKGAICHKSGVPIKRVKLLRIHKDPVIIHRKRWDHQRQKWVRDTGKDGELKPDEISRADRAYVGGNNHHIEIRENEQGKWTGIIVPTFDVARRVRVEKRGPVDRSDDPAKGGRFVMSLAEGETVYMKHKDNGQAGCFVVFKLDKPQKIQFKHHWDARRAKGETDDEGKLIEDSTREEIPVSATQLRDLAPLVYEFPVKVRISPLGRITMLSND